MNIEPRIAFLDIETAPAVVYTWGLYKPVIGMNQIIEPSRIICFSYQFYGDKKVGFKSEFHDGREDMLNELHRVLDEADIVVGYNSNSFDIPWIEGELILNGYAPPSPFQKVDLYREARKHMKLLSGKLDYLSLRLLDDRKVAHEGFGLWAACLAGDEKAWARMKKYAIKDTALLPRIYEILRPWIRIPNVAVSNPLESCTRCGSENLQRRGFSRKATGVYQRYQCQECNGWMTSSRRLGTTPLRTA